MPELNQNPVVHVVDDDAAFRRSLVFLLESLGWPVVAHASAAEFLAACPVPPADFGCLVLDIRMPGMNGLELQQALRARGWTPAVVFMTGHGDVELAVQAMKQGAFDFLEKPFRDQALLDTVAAAVRHGSAERITTQRRAQAQSLLERLTPREREVARLVALGEPNKQVARELAISEKTVHVHRQHVMEKAEVGSAAELARLMLRIDPRALD
ncbi:MAG: response regulator [Gammaproteobacteria bacterium]|uniref:response regulator transcription factor n=1 Tax=Rhodoferax sp. TaxID=50421 RepID=UPI001806DD31|nr:response regulator [Rhodoferax sp.]MBU3898240.1 response regulator [Gammaproteobacteria bacterium]MBA3059061.1 response regulator transcription factor [Rhodoferax sp.]MBU3996990.1 response regulator [Gammaproteobacteria bacterium]MBU4081425.1 response regulator [Gammaproteobacteria bacterium]MBU4114204.1 response regulator [Gammaproteobacteria bacterium]